MTLIEQILLMLVGGLAMMFLVKKEETSLQMGLTASLMALWKGIELWSEFDNSVMGYQFVVRWESLPLNWVMGLDGMSMWLVLLTLLLMPVCLLSSWTSIKENSSTYTQLFLVLEVLLVLVFSVLDVFLFYVFFETMLIPMFYIMGVWGGSTEKMKAAYYFFFYTLMGSLVMLTGMMWLYVTYSTTDLMMLQTMPMDETIQKWLWVGFFASLAVKIPMFPFHLWLPQAHVEAPLAGSVLLAGVLLKLGGYGFIRWVLALFPLASEYYSPLMMTLSVMAMIYASLMTLSQIDMKRLIAYSSVAHMGMVTAGMFGLSWLGVSGAMLIMMAHGFVSSALFMLVTMLYDKYHSSIFKYYRGVATFMPIYATVFFLFILANIAAPLTINFIGEFLVLAALFKYSLIVSVLASTGMVLSAAYSLFFYNRMIFGSVSNYLLTSSVVPSDLSRRELNSLWPLLIPTILFGLNSELMLVSLAF